MNWPVTVPGDGAMIGQEIADLFADLLLDGLEMRNE
jgi:hypothetical protein